MSTCKANPPAFVLSLQHHYSSAIYNLSSHARMSQPTNAQISSSN